MSSPYDRLYDGVNLPAKDKVAAAIAAVRSRGQAVKSLSPLNGTGSTMSPVSGLRGPMSSRSVESASSAVSPGGGSTLFRPSATKVQSFSFGSDITDSSVGSPVSNPVAASPNAAKRIASSSMAQLRARRIIHESRNKPTAVSTAIQSTPSSDDDSDASTDLSSLANVDPQTIAQVSEFIDSLQKKKCAASAASSPTNAGLPPKSPKNPASPTRSRYPSLANAKNAMASSQVPSSSSQGKTSSRALHVATEFEEDGLRKSAPSSSTVNDPTPRRRNVAAASLSSPSRRKNNLSPASLADPSSRTDRPSAQTPDATTRTAVGNRIASPPEHDDDDLSDCRSSFDDDVSTDDSSGSGDVDESTRRDVAKFIDSLNNKTMTASDDGASGKKMASVQEPTDDSAAVYSRTAAAASSAAAAAAVVVVDQKRSDSEGVDPETEKKFGHFLASMNNSTQEAIRSISTPRVSENQNSTAAGTENKQNAVARPKDENKWGGSENPHGAVIAKEGVNAGVSVFTKEIKYGVVASPKVLKEGSNAGVSVFIDQINHGVVSSPKSNVVEFREVFDSPIFPDKGSTQDTRHDAAVASPKTLAPALNDVVEPNVVASPRASNENKADTPVSYHVGEHRTAFSSPKVENAATVVTPNLKAQESSNTVPSYLADDVESSIDATLHYFPKNAPKTVASQLNEEAESTIFASLQPSLRPSLELNVLIPNTPVANEASSVSNANERPTGANPSSPSKTNASAKMFNRKTTPTARDENESKSPTSLSSPATKANIADSPSSRVDNKNKRNSSEESLAYISEQIKQVVRSEVPSLTLGKVLAEANRRGVTLDIVTEIYKQERFKVSSEKIAKWEAEAQSHNLSKTPKEVSSGSMERQFSVTTDSAAGKGSQSQSTHDNGNPSLQELRSPAVRSHPTTPATHKLESLVQKNEIRCSLKKEGVSAVLQDLPSPSAGSAATASSSHVKGVLAPTIEKELPHVNAESSNLEVSTIQKKTPVVVDAAEEMTIPVPRSPATKSSPAKRIASPCAKSPSNVSIAVSQADENAATRLESSGNKSIDEKQPVNSPDVESPDHCTTSSPGHDEHFVSDKNVDGGMIEGIIAKIKTAVRSDNPSEEFGKILAAAKANRIPINPLVELYTRERMTLSSVPAQNGEFPVKDIVVSKTDTEQIDLTPIEQFDDDIVKSYSNLSAQQGLSETQLLQLQQLINISEGEKESDYYHDADPDNKIENSQEAHLEDIDAFFSRFSIDVGRNKATDDLMQTETMGEKSAEDKTTVVKSSESLVVDSTVSKSQTWSDSKQGQNIIDYDFAELEQMDSSLFSERGHVAEVRTLNSGIGTVLYVQDSSLELEFVEPIESKDFSVPKKERKQKTKKRIKEKKKKPIKLKPRDNRRLVILRDDLPGYMGYWKSPWERNRSRQGIIWGSSRKDGINGVDAAARCARRSGSTRRRHCFLPEKERTKGHPGYRDIDFYSLYEATNVKVEDQEIDSVPWECRDVRQRFLHEKSVESRNWFGSFELNRGNDRIHHPVALPKSLQLTVTRIPDPEEWNENWYTSWRSRRDNPNNLIAFTEYEITTGAESTGIEESSSSLDESEEVANRSSNTRRKVTIEIGSLCPVRVKAGERISRVHPDYTSSLRSSRWRKKYLSGVQFPGS
ncbi:hypothetical protein ACHAW6_013672 [Cyclotella cf. meneghiniana]